jgi:D-serine deaminase-like pyridoxal phosphate-dependent protein
MNQRHGMPVRLWNLANYQVQDEARIVTPALALYPEILRENIKFTIQLLGGNPDRWRPHVKTAKLGAVMRTFADLGVKQFKCATTLEMRIACLAGAVDVLVAYSLVGANAGRTLQVADEFPKVRVSALVESPEQVESWRRGRVGLFVDINPGMDRTGIEQARFEQILEVILAIRQASIEFRGLHYYDGHLNGGALAERISEAHRGYRCLLDIVKRLEADAIAVQEVITSSTPTFPAALSFPGFTNSSFLHRVSPGTIVYCDTTSLVQLPPDYGYRPAAIIVSRVVSHPRQGIITCDAGHKTLSVDVGVPNCAILGKPEFRPLRPSEEHLPIEIPHTMTAPALGDFLYLVPKHVCPTVNNFDYALFIRDGRIQSVEPVSARGREQPLFDTLNTTESTGPVQAKS